MKQSKLLCAVVNLGAASHVIKLVKESGVHNATISIGHGSGKHHGRISDFLGLSDERKEIVEMIVDNVAADKAVKSICNGMKIEKPHHGIAFTLLLTDADTENNTAQDSEVKEKMYKLITVIVDKGMAEDVIDAAKQAGARGGTIVNARFADPGEPHKLFSIEIEPEKEKVFIIVKTELKTVIVKAITDCLEAGEDNTGILYVMDIDEVHGLHE